MPPVMFAMCVGICSLVCLLLIGFAFWVSLGLSYVLAMAALILAGCWMSMRPRIKE